MKYKAMLFDLDGTLLQSNKTISNHTLQAIKKCREEGMLIGIATARCEARSMQYIRVVEPDILILSGGAAVKYKEDYVYIDAFSTEEINHMICLAREICGADCGLTVDTLHEHYANDDKHLKVGNGVEQVSIHSDFVDFSEPGLKVCVKTSDTEKAKCLAEKLAEYDFAKFTGEDWYKITKKTATKELGVQKLCEASGLESKEIIAFGDDLVDSGMMKFCGLGVAMGNSIQAALESADVVIGSNDEDGIAEFLKTL